MKQTIMLRRTVGRRITLANLQDTLIVLTILKRLTSLTRVQITLCPIPVRGRSFTLTPPGRIRILARRTPANLRVRTVHTCSQRTLLPRRTTHPRTRITRFTASVSTRNLPIIRTPAILTQRTVHTRPRARITPLARRTSHSQTLVRRPASARTVRFISRRTIATFSRRTDRTRSARTKPARSTRRRRTPAHRRPRRICTVRCRRRTRIRRTRIRSNIASAGSVGDFSGRTVTTLSFGTVDA